MKKKAGKQRKDRKEGFHEYSLVDIGFHVYLELWIRAYDNVTGAPA